MPRPIIPNPWQIGDSDSDGEINNGYDAFMSLPPKPTKSNTLARRSEPILPDWHPIDDEIKNKGKFGITKTTPLFEKGPSSHKPVFSGFRDLKQSLPSSHTNLRSMSEHKTPLPLPTLSSLDPISSIEQDLTKFIYMNIPEDHSSFIHCTLRRDKTGIQKGFFPTFYLYIHRPDNGKKIFLLAARKVPKISSLAEYLITTDIETLSEKSGGNGCVGKLRENNLKGTAYTLYDNGKSPNKVKKSNANKKHGLRRELISVFYNTNLFGLKGPRQINAVIPEIGYDIQPTKYEDTILDLWRDRRLSYLIQLRNREPTPNEGKKGHTLQFIGYDEIQSSVKNFQIIVENKDHEEQIVMQFGRTGDNTFLLDYRYPLSAIQAFGIALSAFDSGISRE
ncbi:unnamed protein product [Rotaria socialis]|uniref:Tubby C-terminal domain-containing protein n=1 Tax=Rotaria socialis TaxID=392032 RepID=A0A817RA49_9BILA|nr:unnamed protein product [Rotaria socialis]CAF3588126.1 unnamed protein product [Rotaria socialis]CAF3764069.1 unnamed protein product [Rotaria socialis]